MNAHIPQSSRRSLLMAVYAMMTLPLGLALVSGWVMLSHPSIPVMLLAIPFFLVGLLRPQFWLAVVIACLPIADQTIWTGNPFFTEGDAILGALLAGLALRTLINPVRDDEDMRLRWRMWPYLVVLLILASYIVALIQGIMPLPAFNEASFVIFGGNIEALRLARGPLLAIWCLPWLSRYGIGLRNLSWGAVLALLGIGASVMLERISFTAITDFSSDYRTTGPFWEMHVGGAALDGALLLTLPFALWFALRGRGPLRIVSAIASLLGAYAILAGFTRSTYVAAALSIVILGLWFARQQKPTSSSPNQPNQSFQWAVLSLLVVLLVGGHISFPTSGYRGLLALLIFILCGWLAGGWAGLLREKPAVIAGILVGLLLGGSGWVLSQLWGKAVYLQIFACLVLGFGAAYLHETSKNKTLPIGLVVAATVWAGATAINVAGFWGGDKATTPMLTAVAIAALPILASLLRSTTAPLWIASRQSIMPFAVTALCASMAIAVGSSYYADERFATVGHDMEGRIGHWKEVLQTVDSTEAELWGHGAGQFPMVFRWVVSPKQISGDFHIVEDGYNNHLIMNGPLRSISFGELFRLSQRLRDNTLALPATVQFKARAKKDSGLHVDICHKHLLYNDGCGVGSVNVPGDGEWHDLQLKITSANLSKGAFYTVRPLVFSIGVERENTAVEVASVQLFDASSTPLLQNADFSQGEYRWLPSSDRMHLAWHAKNIFLHLLVENGALGVLALGFALLTVLGRLSRQPRLNHPYAAPVVAGIFGLVAAGLFDSIIDSPRVAFMFFLWIGIGLGLRSPQSARNSKQKNRHKTDRPKSSSEQDEPADIPEERQYRV